MTKKPETIYGLVAVWEKRCDRLRAVNAKLLEALIQCIDHPITGYERQLAREAIEEARK